MYTTYSVWNRPLFSLKQIGLASEKLEQNDEIPRNTINVPFTIYVCLSKNTIK